MQIAEWIKAKIAALEAADIATARLDALVLLEDATGQDRAWILAHPDFELEPETLKQLDTQIERRAGHEPLAYIRGKSEFYGREFIVTPATLQPRPETETMLALLKQILEREQRQEEETLLVDVGTGSGCVAVTAKLEWPNAAVHATEINENALEIARQNAHKLGAAVEFHQGNLLEPLLTPHSPLLSPSLVILANLPYVPDSHTINPAAMQEPRLAIFGGEDGLDLYRELFKQLQAWEQKTKPTENSRPQYILTESLPFQHQTLSAIARQAGYKLQQTDDLIQVFAREPR